MNGPEGLRVLADWFDTRTDLFPLSEDEVQRDLRRWADDMEKAADLLAKAERSSASTRYGGVTEQIRDARQALTGDG